MDDLFFKLFDVLNKDELKEVRDKIQRRIIDGTEIEHDRIILGLINEYFSKI